MAEPELAPLAGHGDVRVALGISQGSTYDDITMLPSTMQVRMDTTLAKVSRRFRMEAQRIFTPGAYSHRLKIGGDAIRLAEIPSAVSGITIEGLDSFSVTAFSDPTNVTGGLTATTASNTTGPTYEVIKNWIVFNDADYWQLSGRHAIVDYSWDTPVPTDVVAAVADIVGRNLTVDPMSAINQSKLLQTRHFRQEMANWVSDGTTGFTDDDIAQARAYRYPTPARIMQTYSMNDTGISQAFMSDSSW